MELQAIAVVGLPTSGKTTLGSALGNFTGHPFIDIDDGPAKCTYPQELDPYRSPDVMKRKQDTMWIRYRVLEAAVAANLSIGRSLVIAACYSSHAGQQTLQEIVTKYSAKLKIIWCQYHDTDEEVKRRLRHRLQQNLPGGCRSIQHYQTDKAKYPGVCLPHLAAWVDIENIQPALEKALAYIQS